MNLMKKEKYLFTIKVEFEAVDDVEAWAIVRDMKVSTEWKEAVVVSKLHQIYKDRLPRQVQS